LTVLEDRRLMSTFTVINTDDSGPGSLRDAITQANADSGASTIDFDATVFGTPQTITLTNGPLELSNTGGAETIIGPAAGLTVSGGGASRVFQVDKIVTASISGLTITGGSVSGPGGGLANDGGTATLGWRESTPLLRTLTGALFGLASAWYLYPLMDRALAPFCEVPTHSVFLEGHSTLPVAHEEVT